MSGSDIMSISEDIAVVMSSVPVDETVQFVSKSQWFMHLVMHSAITTPILL